MVIGEIIQAVFFCYYVNDRMIAEDDIVDSLTPVEVSEHLERLVAVFPQIISFMKDNEGQFIDVTTCTDILLLIQQIPYPDSELREQSIKELKRSFDRLIEAYNFWTQFLTHIQVEHSSSDETLTWLKEQME